VLVGGVQLASSSLLRLGQETDKEATKNRESVYLLLDEVWCVCVCDKTWRCTGWHTKKWSIYTGHKCLLSILNESHFSSTSPHFANFVNFAACRLAVYWSVFQNVRSCPREVLEFQSHRRRGTGLRVGLAKMVLLLSLLGCDSVACDWYVQ